MTMFHFGSRNLDHHRALERHSHKKIFCSIAWPTASQGKASGRVATLGCSLQFFSDQAEKSLTESLGLKLLEPY